MERSRFKALSFLLSLSMTVSWSLAAGQPPAFELIASSTYDFARPHDIVLSPDGSVLYVADNGNDSIVALDSQTLERLGAFGDGDVAEPHDVAFDARGRLLVADTGHSQIAIYDVSGAEGTFVDSLQGPMRRPEGVAVDSDGRVYATGSASGNLVVYDGDTVVAETSGFSSPHDVAIGPDGGIWIADANNDRLVRLDSDLQITTVLRGAPYDFDGPRYMDFDSKGRLYVADKYSHAIKVIDHDGEMVTVLGDSRAGRGPGQFDRPEGVAIRDGALWIADTYNDRIVRYRILDE